MLHGNSVADDSRSVKEDRPFPPCIYIRVGQTHFDMTLNVLGITGSQCGDTLLLIDSSLSTTMRQLGG